MKSDLRANALPRETIPGQAPNLGQGNLQHLPLIIWGAKLRVKHDHLWLDLKQDPAIGRHPKRAIRASAKEVQFGRFEDRGEVRGLQLSHGARSFAGSSRPASSEAAPSPP